MPKARIQNALFQFAHDADGRGSVVLWRRCSTLCTSGFMNDVIFANIGRRRHVDSVAASDVIASSCADQHRWCVVFLSLLDDGGRRD